MGDTGTQLDCTCGEAHRPGSLICPRRERPRIVYADPPWPYYGDPNKMAAAGKHYDLMTLPDICALPVADICDKPAACFMWATGPRLTDAIEAMQAWGFHYRGVAWVWVKTRQDGAIIHGQGVQPTFTKPTTEFVLAGSTNKAGRPFPIHDKAMGQVVLHPRGAHSVKPAIFRDLIVRLCGDLPRVELFARTETEGWDVWGNEVESTVAV